MSLPFTPSDRRALQRASEKADEDKWAERREEAAREQLRRVQEAPAASAPSTDSTPADHPAAM